jgi:NAD(P)-dependent dehydrogenase (short-subunit alcohol dehydrogenase family)
MPTAQKNVFLTGATSGIGRAAADHLRRAGFAVWGTTRSRERAAAGPPDEPLIVMDLEDHSSINAAWDEALQRAGHFDLVIQNAGSGIFGPIEEITRHEATRQWQILVEGPLHVLRLAAAHLRARGAGTIIGISSLAAEMPLPFAGHYSAGKAAFSALLGSLAMELQPFGVRVVDLRPGDIRTAFNDAVPLAKSEASSYAPWSVQAWRESVSLMNDAPLPDLVARDIVRIARSRRPPAVARSGTFWQAGVAPLGVRFLPRAWMLALTRGYYGLTKIDRARSGN